MGKTHKGKKMIISFIAGIIIIPGSVLHSTAAEKPDGHLFVQTAGIESMLETCLENEVKQNINLYPVSLEQGEYLNMAYSDTGDSTYIRNAPAEYEDRMISVTADVLNVRSGQGTEYAILDQIYYGEQYQMAGNPVNGWYPVMVRNTKGWICGDYVTESIGVSYEDTQEYGNSVETAGATVQGIPVTGQAVIDFACQFIGNPYVWGGTSLTQGADCSGFVQSVYAHFGINLPRTTYDMVNSGYGISYEEAEPGDLILYDGHVGLYMGDGTIVNAMNEEDGIGICSATYTDIIAVRRVL